MACTTILVSKRASYDGSTIVARNEDSGNGEFCPKVFRVVKPAEQPRRYRSVISHVEIDLPDDPLQYTSVPNALGNEGIWGEAGFNTANVGMSATETLTTNERVLGADPLVELRPAHGKPGDADYRPEVPGGIGEEDLLTIVLPYVKTAREGVLRTGELLERYGTYEMNGIAFSDVDEIWWLETVGGHHWIAKRVPDDCYVTMPNQLGIDRFDLTDAFGDQSDHLCSADLREWMDANHLDLTMREDRARNEVAARERFVFNPREAFGSHSERDHVYNTPRAWYMQRFLNPHQGWDGAQAAHGPEDDDLPWAQVPERKVTIEDVKFVLSSHFDGTPFDPYDEIGTPEQRRRYRTIGINRQSQLAVLQLRPYAPAACRAVQWMAYGSNAFNTLTPFFANVDATPAYLANTTARVTTESFYWANRIIAALADAHYKDNVNDIDQYVEKTMAAGHAAVRAADEGVALLLAAGEKGPGTDMARAGETGMAKQPPAGPLASTRSAAGTQIAVASAPASAPSGAPEAGEGAAETGAAAVADAVAARFSATTPARAPEAAIARAEVDPAHAPMGDNPAVRRALAQVNDRIAENLKSETEKLLDKVLYTTSMRMRNAFSLSDH